MDDAARDVLKEIASVGAGHASTSLSQMTDTAVDITFPAIESVPVAELPGVMGGAGSEVVTVELDIHSSAELPDAGTHVGTLFLVFSRADAKALAGRLTREPGDGTDLTGMEESALKETGNVLAGSCLHAMAQYVDMELVEGMPRLVTGSAETVLERPPVAAHDPGEEALLFRTTFTVDQTITASFVFLFHPDRVRTLLDRLKIR